MAQIFTNEFEFDLTWISQMARMKIVRLMPAMRGLNHSWPFVPFVARSLARSSRRQHTVVAGVVFQNADVA
jgi:hypothetical protein